MNKYIKSLEGINYIEWQKLKIIVDNKFNDEKYKNTFKCDEDVLEELKAII